MTIHDYYLSEVNLSEDVEKQILKIGNSKRQILNSIPKEENDYAIFYPIDTDLQNFPQNSTLIKIAFTLKKPYTSKDEGEFYLLEWTEKKKGKDEPQKKIIENPIVRDKFTGLPMVKPSTWKGHLRFSARKVEWDKKEKKKQIIKRLFGTESGEDETLKGRLYFFPTFFEEDAERDVITPLKRDTRTPTDRGPIPLEVMKPGKKGEFYLLYIPFPKGNEFKEEDVKEDIEFLTESLKLMFYTYGFSAKKTSGFGVIQKTLNEGKLWIKMDTNVEEKKFSNLDDLKNNKLRLQ